MTEVRGENKNMIGLISHSWARTQGGLMYPIITAPLLSPFTLPSLVHIFLLSPQTFNTSFDLTFSWYPCFQFHQENNGNQKTIKAPLLIASVPIILGALSLLQVKTFMIQCKANPSTCPTVLLQSHLPKDIAPVIPPFLYYNLSLSSWMFWSGMLSSLSS